MPTEQLALRIPRSSKFDLLFSFYVETDNSTIVR
jgi:hypothetical protein